MRYTVVCLFLFLSSGGYGNYVCNAPCVTYADLSGVTLGFQGGASRLLTPDVRDRIEGSGLRGYERISGSWGVFAGYNWTLCNSFLFGFQGAYFDNGEGRITYESSNQYGFRSREWDFLALLEYLSPYGYNVYVKGGIGWVKETYKRIFAHSGIGDPTSSKYGIFPVFAFGFAKMLPCKFNAFIELRLTIAHDTSKLTHALRDIDPGPGFVDVLKNVASIGSFHFGISKSL